MCGKSPTSAANSPSNTVSALWQAPFIDHPLDATVEVPASKSLTNRLLLLQYLSDTPRPLHNVLLSRDSDLMMAALAKLRAAKDEETVTLDVGLAGTVMRFLPPVAALRRGRTIFVGDPEVAKRPNSPMLAALRQLGLEVEKLAGETADGRTLLFSITGSGEITADTVKIDASSSSQFVSGLLLAAAKFPRGLTIIHTSEKLPSLPHIEMTVEVLSRAGVLVITNGFIEKNGLLSPPSRAAIYSTSSQKSSDCPPQAIYSQNHCYNWSVSSSAIQLPEMTVEPDLSNAGPFLAAALANPCGGKVSVPNWPEMTTQPGDYFREVLAKMGAKVSVDQGILTVESDGAIRGVDIDLSKAGEITPTVSALCALAGGESTLRGIGHLRGHETDRLAAIVAEVRKLGREAEVVENGTAIWIGEMPEGGLHLAQLSAYKDHRMATFAAVVGLRVKGVTLDDIACTSKTMPDFEKLWHGMLSA